MNLAQIEEKLSILITSFDKEKFIYEFLLTYGLPKASITRIKKGNLNLSKDANEISWKKKLYFRDEQKEDLHITLSNIEEGLSHKQRFVIVTDYKTWLASDTKTGDKLDIPFKDLPQYYDFFLPWAGMEKTQHQNENPADVKAAEKMAKLFDEIKKDNPQDDPSFNKDLNVFLSRLLFCFFAEDTNIFGDNQFTNALASHTKVDGSDLNTFFDEIFKVLNKHKTKRGKLAAYLDAFPYVNGGLFEQSIGAPTFTRKSRQAIIAAGELNWKDINPDIFGSMFQAVIGVEQRGSLGQHYTSVPNIMKVIEPLFLNDLYEEYEKNLNKPKQLRALLSRISKIKIFDPACGSGNFLIIAYKELRRLEIKIIEKLKDLRSAVAGFQKPVEQLSLIPKSQLTLAGSYVEELFSKISLTQFYGIEIDAFAVEIAQLSLWLAEHQMNVEFFQALGKTNPTLPLKQAGHIVCANACRIDWEEVCPKRDDEEIYLLGNPPYLGGKMQSDTQKEDMKLVFGVNTKYKLLDYVACWFYKGSKYLSKFCSLCFVSTSSICEGSQVNQLWPKLFDNGSSISFAYTPFNWKNNAKSKAGVTCTIIGLTKNASSIRHLYSKQKRTITGSNINAYLTIGSSISIEPRPKPISDFPKIVTGNNPYEGGNLLLTPQEKDNLISKDNRCKEFIRKVIGSREFINSIERWCIWIPDTLLQKAGNIPLLKEKISDTKKWRSLGGDVARSLVSKSHKFRFTNTAESHQIIIPMTSSGRRIYFPIGLLKSEFVILASALAIYDPEPFIFSIVNSYLHGVWVKLIGGKMRADYRYNSTLCYNTFPFPSISKSRKEELTNHTFRILEEREKHPEKTLAQLYDPDKMPDGLREAHRLNDLAVERCYRSKPFESDEERLEYLFKLYEKMILEEKDKETLFQKEKKARKKRK